MDKPILSNVNIQSYKTMKQTLAGSLFITFPNCDHQENYKGISKEGYEKTARDLIEKQHGLCGVCYYAHCVKNEVTPWYSK